VWKPGNYVVSTTVTGPLDLAPFEMNLTYPVTSQSLYATALRQIEDSIGSDVATVYQVGDYNRLPYKDPE